ncbi:conserved hypothetical protein [Ricinus communis]|uniref:Uncharacterized protein n=1 Tax=Ricinus communis TaxID=3988 RepID=B9RLY8_RICCO|nr:conserved hypothetical protein [Ricinus communis]
MDPTLAVDYIYRRNTAHNSPKKLLKEFMVFCPETLYIAFMCFRRQIHVYQDYLCLELSFEFLDAGQSSCSTTVIFNLRFLRHR